MSDESPVSLREQARRWTCNQFAITNHDDDAAALLRKAAASIEALGAIDILDITFARQSTAINAEVTLTVYFTLAGEPT